MRRTAKYPQVTNVVRLLNDRTYNPDVVTSRVRTKMQFDPFIHSIELATELTGQLIEENKNQCLLSINSYFSALCLFPGHHGCVNSLEWSEDGRLLASASDDYHVTARSKSWEREVFNFPFNSRS
jgi:WD40 repeat protein